MAQQCPSKLGKFILHLNPQSDQGSFILILEYSFPQTLLTYMTLAILEPRSIILCNIPPVGNVLFLTVRLDYLIHLWQAYTRSDIGQAMSCVYFNAVI